MSERFEQQPEINHDNWRRFAECADTDPDLFFPAGTTGVAEETILAAKAVCAECVVKVDCLEYAITTNQQYGVWGGTSEEERRGLRRAWVSDRRRA